LGIPFSHTQHLLRIKNIHSEFYKKITEIFNEKFSAPTPEMVLMNKIGEMRKKWKGADRVGSLMMGEVELPPLEMKGEIGRHCHYYFRARNRTRQPIAVVGRDAPQASCCRKGEFACVESGGKSRRY